MSSCLIAVNTLTMIDSMVYSNHCELWYKLGKHFPDWKFMFYTPQRMGIDRCRNEAVKLALKFEMDYVFFIDDDVALHGDTFKSLVAADKDIVMAETYIRTYPFKAMFFKGVWDEAGHLIGMNHYEDFQKEIDENGLLRVDAIGCSAVLIKCELLKKLEAPYFITVPDMHTEDVYLCLKALKLLGRDGVSIYVDTKVPTSHYMDKQLVHKTNVEILRKYTETEELTCNARDITTKEESDRGDKYARNAEASFA